MEAGLNPFHFPELSDQNQFISSGTQSQDELLLSRIGLDQCYSPDIVHMLDDSLFHFGMYNLDQTHEHFSLEYPDEFDVQLCPDTRYSFDDLSLPPPPLSPISTAPAKNASERAATLLMVPGPTRGGKEVKVDEEESAVKGLMAGTLSCKNLVSERNRRKKLSHQLLALRALVPNITKMDKRSVLVDALAYLQSLHEETSRIQAELKKLAKNNLEPCVAYDNFNANPLQQMLAPARSSRKKKAHILEIGVEKIEERRFMVKITCKGGSGLSGELIRVIESLGHEITYSGLQRTNSHHVLATAFIKVRRQRRMTEEKLKDFITRTALSMGLTVKTP